MKASADVSCDAGVKFAVRALQNIDEPWNSGGDHGNPEMLFLFSQGVKKSLK